jgi:hypothetical protein
MNRSADLHIRLTLAVTDAGDERVSCLHPPSDAAGPANTLLAPAEPRPSGKRLCQACWDILSQALADLAPPAQRAALGICAPRDPDAYEYFVRRDLRLGTRGAARLLAAMLRTPGRPVSALPGERTPVKIHATRLRQDFAAVGLSGVIGTVRRQRHTDKPHGYFIRPSCLSELQQHLSFDLALAAPPPGDSDASRTTENGGNAGA